jgi:hypothetical protein
LTCGKKSIQSSAPLGAGHFALNNVNTVLPFQGSKYGRILPQVADLRLRKLRPYQGEYFLQLYIQHKIITHVTHHTQKQGKK